jgi:hypothetical protein
MSASTNSAPANAKKLRKAQKAAVARARRELPRRWRKVAANDHDRREMAFLQAG